MYVHYGKRVHYIIVTDSKHGQLSVGTTTSLDAGEGNIALLLPLCHEGNDVMLPYST